ncbi:MAG TPA: MXAN_5187 family protein [Polyangiaceae bacterium]|jgi:hypothetical protein
MILSRVWYVLLGLAVAVALYVVYIAVGQYDRQATRALKEGLASDSQTVEWALKIDARRRLDALLAGSVDSTLQQALVAANATKDGKVPETAKVSAKKALNTVNEAIPADWRDDAMFAVDRDGQVVAALGFDQVQGNDDFELGGYPAVNDALHGWLRDDVWLLGSKMYVVVARPVEYDATQRPAGAIVGLKEVNQRFAADLAKRTRTALAFFVGGSRVAGGVGAEGFDEEKLDAVGADLAKIDDKTYGDGGRSEVRMLTDDLGAMYARLPGDVWTQGGGFAVARSKRPLAGPLGFLANADDKDKANVPWFLLIGVVLLAGVLGIAMTVFEHTLPLRELLMQAERLKVGAMDGLQVARFRGSYRLAAQALNQGMERSIEKAGGVTRKPADLESIIGPVPAQPAMSAFSFPMADGGSSPMMQPPSTPFVPPAPTTQPMASTSSVARPTPVMATGLAGFPPPAAAPGPPPAQRPPPNLGRPGTPPPTAHAAPTPSAPGAAPPPPPASAPKPPPPLSGANQAARPPAPPPAPPPEPPPSDEDDDATMVGAVPAELLAQATGEHRAADDTALWVAVYEDFIRTKKQCGEATDGLTYEKFSHTLKKNRDALIQRHGCKRVKFSVYVKEGRASLKATPVKD